LAILVGVTAVFGFGACGQDKPGSMVEGCPNDVPRVCPSAAPTYRETVAPVLALRCGTCHTVGGIESARPFDTYDQVARQRTSILSQIHTCRMPPANQPQPTADERATILAWLVCGALPDACPDDAPGGCTTPAPGFTADIAPIIANRCGKCHAPGGKVPGFPFQTHAQIEPFAGDIKLQIETCAMPPPPEPALTAPERQSLFGWILCGALSD
jgi:uncharacterized membrane protein